MIELELNVLWLVPTNPFQALEKKQEAMQKQIDAQEAQLKSSTVVAAGKTMQLASKEDWQLSQPDLLTAGEDELVSQKQCAEMIQKALHDKVAPILQATVGTVVQTCAELTERVQKVEEEIKTLKIRCAWVEKDMLAAQVDVAKRTILARNWPESWPEIEHLFCQNWPQSWPEIDHFLGQKWPES